MSPESEGSYPYRLLALEKWRESMEQNRIPTEMALHDARLRAVEQMVTKQDAIITELAKREQERQGWWAGNKAIMAGVLFFVIQLGGFLLLISDKIG